MKIIKNTMWKEADVSGAIIQIPAGWQVTPLGSAFEIVGGGTPSTDNESFWGGSIPWIGPKDMADNRDRDIASGTRFLTEDGARTLGRKKVSPGSVVISTRAPVGYANIAEVDMFTNQGCHSLLPSANMSMLFAYFWVMFNQDTLNRHSTGTTFKELSGGKLKSLDFVYPEFDSQERIGAVLAQQETVISNMVALVDKLETRLRYFSEELLSGRLRVKEVDGKPVLYKNEEWKETEVNDEIQQVPVDWESSKNEALFSLKKGKKPSEDVEGEVHPYLSVESLRSGIFDSSASNGLLVRAGTVLVIWDGSNSGEVRRTPCDGYVSSTMGAILPIDGSRVLQDFLFRALKAQEAALRSRVQGGGIPHLDGNFLCNLMTHHPVKKSEQALIVSILNNMENEIRQHEQLLGKEKLKFQWLLDNLMTGKYLLQEQ